MSRSNQMLAAIIICLVALTSGCCGLHGGGCGVGGGGCGVVADAGCGGCGGGPGACHNNCGVKNLLYPLLSPRLACGSGCGEIYWNEWACDPPDCCDPCSNSGCYVGPSVCTGPPLIVSVVHCVGRGVSDLLGVILGGIGCGPCELLTCGGCSSCGPAMHAGHGVHGGYIDGGCAGGCAGGCGGGCASASAHGQTIIQENPNAAAFAARQQVPQVRSATHQIRTNHGRSPHRAFSRRFR